MFDPHRISVRTAAAETKNSLFELDAEPGTEWFPAYLLLGVPGLASWLPENLGDGAGLGKRAFRAVREVLHADGAEARRALQAAAPWLLEEYLKTRPARR